MKVKVVIFIVLICFSGCVNISTLVEENFPPEEHKFALQYFDHIKSNNLDSLYLVNDTTINRQYFSKLVPQVSLAISKLDTFQIVKLSYFVTNSSLLVGNNIDNIPAVQTNLEYQIGGAENWIYTQILIKKTNGEMKVSGINFQLVDKSIDSLIAFPFLDGKVYDYIFLLIAISILLFIIYSVILLYKTEMKRKWIWYLFILFSVFKFNYYWGGQFTFSSIFSFQFLGIGLYKPSIISPYIITFGVPLGAIIFEIKRRKLLKINQNSVKLVS